VQQVERDVEQLVAGAHAEQDLTIGVVELQHGVAWRVHEFVTGFALKLIDHKEFSVGKIFVCEALYN